MVKHLVKEPLVCIAVCVCQSQAGRGRKQTDRITKLGAPAALIMRQTWINRGDGYFMKRRVHTAHNRHGSA